MTLAESASFWIDMVAEISRGNKAYESEVWSMELREFFNTMSSHIARKRQLFDDIKDKDGTLAVYYLLKYSLGMK